MRIKADLYSRRLFEYSRASHIQPKTSVKDRRVLSLMGVRARNGKYSVNGKSENKARLALETVSRVVNRRQIPVTKGSKNVKFGPLKANFRVASH
jgi:hypothetical protein